MPGWLRKLLSDQSIRYKLIRGGIVSLLVVLFLAYTNGWAGFWMGVAGVVLAFILIYWIERQG